MHLPQVDIVGAQPLEAGLAGCDQMMARRADVVRHRSHPEARLGRDQELVAAAGDRLAENLFGKAGRIGIGTVEQGDAGIERDVDHAGGFVDLGLTPDLQLFAGAAESGGAETKDGHTEARGTKKSVFHAAILHGRTG